MKLLLDTHIWLWSIGNPGRLNPAVRGALEDPSNEKWLSPISVWEVLLLAEKGRVELSMDPVEWAAQALRESAVREAPLTTEVVLATRGIRIPHRDPADAFLVATAKVFELTLVTADRRLRRVRGISVL